MRVRSYHLAGYLDRVLLFVEVNYEVRDKTIHDYTHANLHVTVIS